MKSKLLIIVGFVFLGLCINTYTSANETEQSPQAPSCQYAWDNPSDGCDNSDLACPEVQVKAGRGAPCPSDQQVVTAPVAEQPKVVPPTPKKCSE